MDKKKKKSKVTLAPPPPAPPVETDDDFVVCVGMSDPQARHLSWSRLTIPAKDMKIARDTCLGSDPPLYVYHRNGFHDCPGKHLKDVKRLGSDSKHPPRSLEHDDGRHHFEYTADPERNGPFPTEFPHIGVSVALGSVIYCLGGDEKVFSEDSFQQLTIASWRYVELGEDTTASGGTKGAEHAASNNEGNDNEGYCHRPRFCDFSKPGAPKWSVGNPLSSPRYSPRMTAFDGKLFVFGGNDPSGDAPFAEVLDPLKGSWEPLPQPRFRMGATDLFVAPIDDDLKMMLLYSQGSQIKYFYDTINKNWFRSDSSFFGCMRTQPVSVAKLNSFYLLDKSGKIFAFNWVLKSWFVGSISGLSNDIRDSVQDCYMPLRHLHDDLFCLIWTGQSCCGKYPLHLTVLQIVQLKNPPPPSSFLSTFGVLRVSVVACFCYWFDSLFSMWAAHTLARGTGSNMDKLA